MTDERDDWADERAQELYGNRVQTGDGCFDSGKAFKGRIAQALRDAFARGERRGLDTLHAEIAQLKKDKSSNDEAYLELSRENGLLKLQLWSRQEQL